MSTFSLTAWHIRMTGLLLDRPNLVNQMLEDLRVLDPATLKEVPADGTTVGEIMIKGNAVMKGL